MVVSGCQGFSIVSGCWWMQVCQVVLKFEPVVVWCQCGGVSVRWLVCVVM